MDRRNFVYGMASLGLMYVCLGTKAISFKNVGKRVGIVGLDSSHAIAFTKVLNTNSANNTYKGYQVVAAYPYGNPDIPLNAKRIPVYTEEIKQFGVRIMNSIEELLENVDVVLLETNDGNSHLAQAETIIRYKKKIFIDKPIANSYEDAAKIFEIAAKHHTPVFSSSALRYISGIENIDKSKVVGAEIYSPAHTEPSHKDLYWYGIHGVEILFTLLGADCQSVQTVAMDNVDIYIGKWSGERVGTLRGIRKGGEGFGGTVFTLDKVINLGKYQGYEPLLQNIVSFFETGISSVRKEDTLAICKFIDAAYESKLSGGTTVLLK